MKRILISFIWIFFLASCSSMTNLVEQSENVQDALTTNTPLPNTAIPIPTKTIQPTPSTTPTITPTVKLPAQEYTPLPLSDELITIDNIDRLQILASWGKGFAGNSDYFQEWERIVITSGDHIYLYDSSTLDEVASTTISIEGMVVDITMPESEKVILLIWPAQNGVITSTNRNIIVLQWSIETDDAKILYEYSNLPCYIYNTSQMTADGEKIICDNETSDFLLIPLNSPDDYQVLKNPGFGRISEPSIEFIPDGSKILIFWYSSGYIPYYNQLLVWDIENLELLGSKSINSYDFVVNPDSQSFAVLLEDQKTVQFYSIETLQPIGKIQAGVPISALAYNNKGDKFVISSENNSISVWEINSESKMTVFSDLEYDQAEWDSILNANEVIDYIPYRYRQFHNIKNIFFSTDDQNIISIEMNHRLTEWDIEKAKIIYQTPIQAHLYTEPIFLEGNSKIAFGDENGTIQVWDLPSHTKVVDVDHENRVLWIVYDQENQRLIFGDGYAEYSLDIDSQKISELTTFQLGKVVINNDKSLLAGYKPGSVTVVNMVDFSEMCRISAKNNQDLLFSPNGKNLLISKGFSIQIWDVSTCQISTIISSDNNISDHSFSENGEYFMISDYAINNSANPVIIKIFETESWKLVQTESATQVQQTPPLVGFISIFSSRFMNCGDYYLLSDGLFRIGDWETPLYEYDPIFDLVPCNETLTFNSSEGYIELLGIR